MICDNCKNKNICKVIDDTYAYKDFLEKEYGVGAIVAIDKCENKEVEVKGFRGEEG